MSNADRSRLRQALDAYSSGRLELAKPVLLELAQRYPRTLDAQTATGMLLAEEGDVAAALPYLERAHRLAPSDHALTSNLGIAYLKLSRAADAESLLYMACRTQHGNAVFCTALAQAQLAQKKYTEAAANFQRASQLVHADDGSDLTDLHYNWALALLGADQPDKAVTTLNSAPGAANSAAVQELLGEATEKAGKYQEAFAHLKRAAELEPSEANLYAYGTELLQHWTFPPAIDIFRYASPRYPESNRLHMGLGVAYFGNNNFAESAKVFQAMLAKEPENAAIADMLGRSCAAQTGVTEPACHDLVAFAQRHPENAPASLYAAISLLHQGSDPQGSATAEALLRSALKANARLPEAWYQLAVLQQGRNDWVGSETSLERAIALRPAYPEAHYRLSRAYAHTGKREAAQQQIALQQQYVEEAKQADAKRMKEVITFLTTSN